MNLHGAKHGDTNWKWRWSESLAAAGDAGCITSSLSSIDRPVQDLGVLSGFKSIASGLVKPYSAKKVPDTKADAGVGKI